MQVSRTGAGKCGHFPLAHFCLSFLVIVLAGFLAPLSAHGQAQQVPPGIITRLSYVAPVNGTFGNRDYQGKAGHLGANSRGDMFFVDTPYNYAVDNAFLVEVPAGTTNEVELLTGIGYSEYGNPVAVDSNDNLYLADQDGFLVFVPFIGGQYVIGVGDVSPSSKPLLPTCNFPVVSNTSDCSVPFNDNNLDNYVQGSDLGVDAAGNIYVIDAYDGISNGSVNRLIQVATDGTVSVLVDNLNEDPQAQLAVDAAGDLYYCDNSTVEFYSAASGYASSTAVGTGLLAPSGVSVDRAGNVYITDTGHLRIVEIPNINGNISSANQYTLNDKHAVQGYNGGAQNGYAIEGVGIDGYGNVYYVGSSSNSINLLAIGDYAFGGFALATPTTAVALNLYVNGAETLGQLALSGPAPGSVPPFAFSSSTCTAATAYTAGFACSFQVIYSASAVGLQPGTVTAYDTSNNPIAGVELNGIGVAPGLDVDPGTVSTLGTGWKQPDAITVDGAGNIFIADASTGSIYRLAPGGGSKTTVAGGFSTPSSVVVDGADNLFIGDSGVGTVVEVPMLGTGAYGTPVVLESGLSGTSGLAIDGNDNVYVADSGNSRVLRLASAGGAPDGSLVISVGSGFKTPVALAIDSSNNLYVSDSGLGEVVQIAIPTTEQNIILTGLSTAAGVAVDAAGDLYAVDSGAQSIYRVAAISGVIDKNFETTLAAIVASPVAVALDNAGNLYATDSADSTVAESVRTAGLLNFGNVNVGATSSTVAAVISNGGTTTLTLNTPYYTSTGAGADFAMQSSAAACASGDMLAQGADCTLAADFSPTAPGTVTETLVFSSSAANSNSQSLEFTGTGSELINSTLTIAVTSPQGAILFGEPVTLTATLAPQMEGSAPPTGTVTFYVDSVAQKPVPLTNDTATITINGLTGGTHTITASYSGDSNYAYAAAPPITITIATDNTTTSITLPPASNPNVYIDPTSAAVGAAVTFTATVTPAGTGTPTGTVTFESGTTVIGTAQVAPQCVKLNPNGTCASTIFVASLTTSSLTAGTYDVVAVYDGDANFNTSSSPSGVQILISQPTILMQASSDNITGNGPPVTLSFESVAGFGTGVGTSNTADLSCTGLPAYATCSFSPSFASVAPNPINSTTVFPPTQVLFNVVTNQPPVQPPQLSGLPPFGWTSGHRAVACMFAVLLMAPPVLLGIGMRPSRRRRFLRACGGARLLLLLVLLGWCALGISGCGNSSQSFLTPLGTYTITVNATITQAGTTTPAPAQSQTFTLTVN
jgi:sugar lactone lactonase YvrE